MIGRKLVYSRRYDANRMTVERNGLYIDIVLGKKLSKKVLGFGIFGRFWRFERFWVWNLFRKTRFKTLSLLIRSCRMTQLKLWFIFPLLKIYSVFFREGFCICKRTFLLLEPTEIFDPIISNFYFRCLENDFPKY